MYKYKQSLSNTNLKFGCNLVSFNMRTGFFGTFVQNSSVKDLIIIKYKL